MPAILSARFKMIDEMSEVLNRIGKTGNAVIAGLEDACAKIDTVMLKAAKSTSQAASSLSELSGDTAGMSAKSRELTSALSGESEKLNKAALNAQLKADKSERAAEGSQRHYEQILQENSAAEKLTDAMKKNAESARVNAEKKRQVADAARQEADSAEQAAYSESSHAKAVADTVQAEEKLCVTTGQAANAEKKAADTFSQAENKAKEYSNTIKNTENNNTGLISSLRLAANTADKQASKFEEAAKKARDKADADREAAQKAKEYHESLKEQLKAEKELTREETSDLADRVENARKLAEEQEKQAKKSEQRAGNLNDEARAARVNAEELEKNAQTEEKLYQVTSKAANAEQKLADTLNKSEKEAAEYGEAMRKAAGDSEEFGNKGGDAISRLEQLLTRAGIIAGLKKIGDAFLTCSNSAAQFESSIAKVSTIADTSRVSLGDISSDVMLLSQNSGQSVTDLTEAAYQAISASVNTADSVKFVNEANMLAVGGFTQQATAADVLTTAINAYGLAVSDATEISDMLITTQNLGKTTVNELAQNMGRVIPLASAYGVEMDNLSSAYAILTKNGIATAESTTYIKSMFSELGDTGSEVAGVLQDETGKSFAQLMEDGYSLADVLAVIGNSVNGNTTAFNNLWSSQEAGIGALALFNAGAGEFNRTLDEMQNSAGATAKAYGAMTSTTEHAHQRMQNAFSNLGITIGTQLNPIMKDLYNGIANVTDGIRGFAEEHPKAVAAVSGTVTALGLAVGAVTAYTAVTKAAQLVTQTFNLTLSASKVGLIIGGIAAAGTAVGVLAHAFSSAKDDVEDYNGTLEQCQAEINSTRTAYENVCKMYDEDSEAVQRLAGEIDTLNKQYQKGGGFVADYEQRLAESRETLNSFTAEYADKMKSINDSEQNGMIAAAQLDALSQKTQLTKSDLDMMSKYADYLNDTFNCNIEVNYDTGKLTGFDPADINSVMIAEVKENRKQAAMESVTGAEFSNEYIDSIKKLRDIESEYTSVKNEILDVMNDPSAVNTTGFTLREADEKFSKQIAEAEKQISEYENIARDAFAVMGNPEGVEGFLDNIEDMIDGFEDLEKSAEKAQEALTPEEAISEAWNNSRDAVEEFGEKVAAITAECRDSLDSMFGLFEKAEMNTENALSLNGAVENLQSQIDYFNQYKEALAQLSELEISDEILSQLNPEQAVAFANELEGMDASVAKDKVDEINSAFDELSNMKDKTADAMTEVQKEFDNACDELQSKLETALSDMDMPEDAAASAQSTMNGYIAQLHASGAQAIMEAQSIANQIQAALNTVASVTIPAPSVLGPMPLVKKDYVGAVSANSGYALVGERGAELVKFSGGERVYTHEETISILSNHEVIPQLWDNAYAVGTKSAQPGVALVGEKGPELVYMSGGEKVYTASETKRIFNNFASPISSVQSTNYENYLSNYVSGDSAIHGTDSHNVFTQFEGYLSGGETPVYMPPKNKFSAEQGTQRAENTSKHEHLIHIKGSGSMKIQGGVGKEEVLSIVSENLIPVLADIIELEIFEEGDGSYET